MTRYEDPGGAASVDAVVVNVSQRSARIRILGEAGQTTFRSGDL
jgi:hypothetical protein